MCVPDSGGGAGCVPGWPAMVFGGGGGERYVKEKDGGLQLTCTFCFFNIKQRKTETRKTASVLKQDPNTKKVKRNAYLI